MRYEIVKVLIETQTEGELLAAEETLLRGQGAPQWVVGSDEGDQLANLCAALHVLSQMKQGVRLESALRHYRTQVREVPF